MLVAGGEGGPHPYHCPRCGKGYHWRQSMLSHQRFECGTERRFPCPHCPHRAQRRHHLQKHLVTVHPEQMRQPVPGAAPGAAPERRGF